MSKISRRTGKVKNAITQSIAMKGSQYVDPQGVVYTVAPKGQVVRVSPKGGKGGLK